MKANIAEAIVTVHGRSHPKTTITFAVVREKGPLEDRRLDPLTSTVLPRLTTARRRPAPCVYASEVS